MQIYLTIIQIFYYVFMLAIVGLTGWDVIKNRKITDKFVGGMLILVLAMRLLFIK